MLLFAHAESFLLRMAKLRQAVTSIEMGYLLLEL